MGQRSSSSISSLFCSGMTDEVAIGGADARRIFREVLWCRRERRGRVSFVSMVLDPTTAKSSREEEGYILMDCSADGGFGGESFATGSKKDRHPSTFDMQGPTLAEGLVVRLALDENYNNNIGGSRVRSTGF